MNGIDAKMKTRRIFPPRGNWAIKKNTRKQLQIEHNKERENLKISTTIRFKFHSTNFHRLLYQRRYSTFISHDKCFIFCSINENSSFVFLNEIRYRPFAFHI